MSQSQNTDSPAFSPEEREVLAPFATNLDGPVFVLTNLPEVIKGALFSRYSRTSLGLRRLLLKEFIEGAGSAFAALAGPGAAGTAAGSPPESHLAVRKAQDFYDRILDGYGDDSIGELGGAHLAAEGISMLAAKAIQDARIGGSPLEKSTRYVSFGQQVGGEFLFYKDPVLMASPHRERYLAQCRALFTAYRDLHEPVAKYIAGIAPRISNEKETVWRQSIRSRAFDSLRGLLPAGTLTNMGVYGNGRFFESLLVKLSLSNLSELREVAGLMRSELTKVIPSFVRRADPNHPHYSGFRDHQIKQAILVHRLANAIPPGQGQDSVSLVEFDSDAEIKVLSALAYPASQSSMAACKEWAAMLTTDQRTQIFRKLAAARSNRRHKPPRATELAVYTFDLVGDFGMYRDLHRHRMLTQERQTLTTRLGYEVPDDVREAGVETSFRNLMNQAADSYEIIAKDYPLEAQYIVPMAYRIRWTMTVNLRALIWLCELRSQPQGHPAYRSMAIRLSEEVARVHQDFSHLFRFMETGEHTLGRRKAERRQTKIQVERDEADAVRIATNQLSLDL